MKYLSGIILFLIFCTANPFFADTFPIGIYNVPIANFNEVKSWGFNTVVWGEKQGYVETADSSGLNVILSLPFDNVDKLSKSIEYYKKFTNILAWYPIDEPDIYKKKIDVVKNVYELFKRLDKSRDV